MGFGPRGRGCLVQASMQRKHRWCSKPLSKVLKQQMLKWGPAMNWQLIQGCTLPTHLMTPEGVIYSPHSFCDVKILNLKCVPPVLGSKG